MSNFSEKDGILRLNYVVGDETISKEVIFEKSEGKLKSFTIRATTRRVGNEKLAHTILKKGSFHLSKDGTQCFPQHVYHREIDPLVPSSYRKVKVDFDLQSCREFKKFIEVHPKASECRSLVERGGDGHWTLAGAKSDPQSVQRMLEYCTSNDMKEQYRKWFGAPSTEKNPGSVLMSTYSFECDTDARKAAINGYNATELGSAAFPPEGTYIGPFQAVDSGTAD